MVYITLRKEAPRLKRLSEESQTKQPRVVTISLLNPPLIYRLSSQKVRKVVKIFC
jgi:hypothetical protein